MEVAALCKDFSACCLARFRFLSQSSREGMLDDLGGVAGVRGCRPVWIKKGEKPVAGLTELLYENSASDNHLDQSFCWWFMKAQRYFSNSWLTCSVCPLRLHND